jgi:aconitate hydratase
VRAVIAEAKSGSPLQPGRDGRDPLQVQTRRLAAAEPDGEEIVTIRGLDRIQPRQELYIELYRPSDGRVARFPVICRIDTETELEYFRHGGVLPYVLRSLAGKAQGSAQPEPEAGGEAA